MLKMKSQVTDDTFIDAIDGIIEDLEVKKNMASEERDTIRSKQLNKVKMLISILHSQLSKIELFRDYLLVSTLSRDMERDSQRFLSVQDMKLLNDIYVKRKD